MAKAKAASVLLPARRSPGLAADLGPIPQVLKSASDDDERPNFLPAKRDVYKEVLWVSSIC